MTTEEDVTMAEAKLSCKRTLNAISPAGANQEDDSLATGSKDSPMGTHLVDGKETSPPASEMEEKAKGERISALELETLKNSKINNDTSD